MLGKHNEYGMCCSCKYEYKETFEEPCANCQNNFVEGTPEFDKHKLLWESAFEAKSSAVVHPTHYNQGNIECIDAMLAAFGEEAVANFCLVNAFKYVWRNLDKNGLEDVDKAIWYLNKYKELVDSD